VTRKIGPDRCLPSDKKKTETEGTDLFRITAWIDGSSEYYGSVALHRLIKVDDETGPPLNTARSVHRS